VNVTCAQEVSPTDIGHLLLLQVHTLLSRVDLFIESISALGHTREQLMFQPNFGPCRELPLVYNKSATAFQHID